MRPAKRRLLASASAAIVPSTVASVAVSAAMRSETQAASISGLLAANPSYQRYGRCTGQDAARRREGDGADVQLRRRHQHKAHLADAGVGRGQRGAYPLLGFPPQRTVRNAPGDECENDSQRSDSRNRAYNAHARNRPVGQGSVISGWCGMFRIACLESLPTGKTSPKDHKSPPAASSPQAREQQHGDKSDHKQQQRLHRAILECAARGMGVKARRQRFHVQRRGARAIGSAIISPRTRAIRVEIAAMRKEVR